MRIINFAYLFIALLCAMVSNQAFANTFYSYNCTNTQLTTSLPAKLVYQPVLNVLFGQALSRSRNYVPGLQGGNTYHQATLNTCSLNGLSGVSVSVTGPPTVTATSTGNICSRQADEGSANKMVVNILITRGAACNVSVTFSVAFTMTSTSGNSGTLSSTLVSGQPTGWVYYNTDTNKIGISPSATYNVTPYTCTLTTSNIAVALPSTSLSSQTTPGLSSTLTPFAITLTGCSATTSGAVANASWVFNTVTGYPNVIANTGAANNVGVQILDSTQTPITNGGKSVIATLTSASVYNANYYASYYSLGNPTTGTVVGNAKFSITYN